MSFKGIRKRIINFILIVSFIVFLIDLLKIPDLIECERLTKIYGERFINQKMYGEHALTEDIFDVKVLEYSDNRIKVYCICDSGEDTDGKKLKYATVAVFEKIVDLQVEFLGDFVVWSDDGNDNNYIAPYWWHRFIY